MIQMLSSTPKCRRTHICVIVFLAFSKKKYNGKTLLRACNKWQSQL